MKTKLLQQNLMLFLKLWNKNTLSYGAPTTFITKFVNLQLLITAFFLQSFSTAIIAQTPVQANGQLKVCGTGLCNQYGNRIQLRGMSTHGIQWYGWGDCLTEASLDALAYDWGSDVLRISLYVQEGGYLSNPAGYTAQVNLLIEAATKRGMYALVDWHQLTPGDPNANLTHAKKFFTDIATKHKDKNNIIYDIANEPNKVSWNRIKDYGDQIIPLIQNIDADAPIFIGTHGWGSLGVSDQRSAKDIVNNPLKFSNIMYTFHFYAASHKENYLRELDWASDRLPIFVTEFGTQNYLGEGANNFAMSQKYLDLMARKKIGWTNWNYSDDHRSGAVWKTGTCGNGPWTVNQLKSAGKWVREKMLYPADNFPGGNGNLPPTVSISSPSNNATFTAPANISIAATANDTDGEVAQVEFFNGTTSLGIDTTRPFTHNWTNVPTGNYTITATATDDKNAKTTSSKINITVGNTPPPPPPSTDNLAYKKPVTVSSTETSSLVGEHAVDGLASTRWASIYNDQQWLYVDLLTTYKINQVKINWEVAYGKSYKIQTSNDANTWYPVHTELASDGGIDDIRNLNASGRYVRILGVVRGTPYGYSIWELEIYGEPTSTSCDAVTASGNDGNVPANVLDGNLNTRWSMNGDGASIQFCLGDVQIVTGIKIASYKGNERYAKFDIKSSQDGNTWNPVATGLRSSGVSLDLESFTFAPVTAKYIQILGHGNSVNTWNSFTEIEIISTPLKMGKTTTSNPIAYPNPTENHTTVQLPKEHTGTTVVVLDGDGNKLSTQFIPAGTTSVTLDLRHYQQSINFIRTISKDGSHTLKVIRK